jgi:hypothetical protein
MTVSDLLEQPCYKSDNINKLVTSCLNNLYNIVILWLYRTCWNNLATSLIISTSLLQAVNLTSCSILVDNLWQAVRTQLVDGLLADLLQDVKFCVCILYTRLPVHETTNKEKWINHLYIRFTTSIHILTIIDINNVFQFQAKQLANL